MAIITVFIPLLISIERLQVDADQLVSSATNAVSIYTFYSRIQSLRFGICLMPCCETRERRELGPRIIGEEVGGLRGEGWPPTIAQCA